MLTKTIEQFVVFKTERDTSLFMFDKARLAATENVETLRLQLIPGDPCPVCGNTEHPYATEHPQLDRVLQELEKGYHQHENAYSTCLALEISLRETGNQLKEIMAVQEQELSTKEIVHYLDQCCSLILNKYPSIKIIFTIFYKRTFCELG